MYASVLKLFDDIRASYWVVPLCMLLCAIALAFFTYWLDTLNYLDRTWLASAVFGNDTEDARATLSVIATAVMGVAGVTFSITIVAVSFASSNFGPRLIGNFMRDRGAQFTLGSFVGTFAFCLIILATVHGANDTGTSGSDQSVIPRVSVMTALTLALSCIAVLIYYIHHVVESINIEQITAAIGRRLQSEMRQIASKSGRECPPNEAGVVSMKDNELTESVVTCQSTGYLQAIDHEKLVELAAEARIQIKVQCRPGDFLTPYDCLLTVRTSQSDAIPMSELQRCFATGAQRTEHQNALFLVEQLSEVIGRALSPGVNDPFTAISCLNWFRVAILEYVHADDPARTPADEKRSAVHYSLPSFERFASVMFDKTRQYIAEDLNALLHTLALLAECAWHAERQDCRRVLVKHLGQFHELGLHQHPDGVNARAVSERFEQAMNILNDQKHGSRQPLDLLWFGGSA